MGVSGHNLAKMAASDENMFTVKCSGDQNSPGFSNHPKFQQMLDHGYGDIDQINQTMLVYLSLSENKDWWNLAVHPCKQLRKFVVRGTQWEQEERETILPVNRHIQLSPQIIRDILNKIKEGSGKAVVTLALVDGDSTINYYRLSDGFIPPLHPELIARNRLRRAKKLEKRRMQFAQLQHDGDTWRLGDVKVKACAQTSEKLETNRDDERVADSSSIIGDSKLPADSRNLPQDFPKASTSTSQEGPFEDSDSVDEL